MDENKGLRQGHHMSNLHRRDYLTGTAAFAAGVTAALAGTGQAQAGDPSFMNNVPDPLLSQKELPTFKFALGSRGANDSTCPCPRSSGTAQDVIGKGVEDSSPPDYTQEVHLRPQTTVE
jgi:hypothetical protein